MANPSDDRPRTHRELVPRDLCSSLVMKPMLTHGMDEPVHDGRTVPGDGYYWCQRSCTCVGPDDGLVHPTSCRPTRPCWRGIEA